MKVTDVIWQKCDCGCRWPVESFVEIKVFCSVTKHEHKESLCPDCATRLEKKLEVK